MFPIYTKHGIVAWRGALAATSRKMLLGVSNGHTY